MISKLLPSQVNAGQHRSYQSLLDNAGIPIAQVALHFGADDIDGTIVEERIMHAAGAQTSKGYQQTTDD